MNDWDAVCWDIGGVILDVASVREAHRAFVGWLVEEHDLACDEAAALETWRTTVGDHFRERNGTEFRAARDAYDRAVAAVVGDSVAWEPRFRAILDETLRPNPHAVETIHALAETDRHLGVVSDVDTEEGRRILAGFGVLDVFDAVTTSEAVGRTKPDPRMFETALDAAGVPAERALMIGDRYEHDVAGAKQTGIGTVAYGADDGPAVDYRVESLDEVLDVVRGDRDA